MPTDIPGWVQLGAVGLLVFLAIAGYRGWFYFGPQVDKRVADLEKERDYWRDVALKHQGITAFAIRHAEPDKGEGE